jgi:hypothetical protein
MNLKKIAISDAPLNSITVTIRTNQHFDKFSLAKRGIHDMRIYQMKAVTNTKFLRMNVLHYEEFVVDKDIDRTLEGVEEMLMHHFPSFKDRGYQRRADLINSFEEVEIETGTLIEEEDIAPANIYFILKGQVAIFKRPEGIYT